MMERTKFFVRQIHYKLRNSDLIMFNIVPKQYLKSKYMFKAISKYGNFRTQFQKEIGILNPSYIKTCFKTNKDNHKRHQNHKSNILVKNQ